MILLLLNSSTYIVKQLANWCQKCKGLCAEDKVEELDPKNENQ